MKTITASVLISLGILALAYAGLIYTTEDKPMEFRRLHTAMADNALIPLAGGSFTLTGGILLLTVKVKPRGIRRQSRRRSETHSAARKK